jgi:hypothetical protein
MQASPKATVAIPCAKQKKQSKTQLPSSNIKLRDSNIQLPTSRFKFQASRTTETSHKNKATIKKPYIFAPTKTL